MRERWGRQVVPVQLPIVDQQGFHGVVDLVTMEAFFYTPNGDGRGKVGEIPHMLENDAKTAHEALIELVAEGKDELMEEFFAAAPYRRITLSRRCMRPYGRTASSRFFMQAGCRNVGTDHLLDFLKVYAPSPQERPAFTARPAVQTSRATAPDRTRTIRRLRGR